MLQSAPVHIVHPLLSCEPALLSLRTASIAIERVAMQQPPDHGPGLLNLPLHGIWRMLLYDDRRALRATCKDLRNVTSTFMTTLHLYTGSWTEERPQGMDELTFFTDRLAARLLSFPIQAKMEHLLLHCKEITGHCAHSTMPVSVPSVLSTCLHHTQHRLAHLKSLYISCLEVRAL